MNNATHHRTGQRDGRRTPSPRHPVTPSPGHPLTPSPRSAFTLVEVLLALALTGVLVGAIYTATTIYQNMTTAGRDEVERSQIVRSVHRKIASDVRSIVFKLPSEEEQAEDPEAALEEGEEVVVAEVQDPSESIFSSAVGIVGDETWLTLHVSRPPRGGLYETQNSDLATISYRLASAEGDALSAAIVDANGGQGGLARVFGDRLTLDAQGNEGNDAALAQSSQLLAPEVRSLRFAYWDGSAWQPNWNSEELGKLPRAVSVTVGLIQRDAAGEIMDDFKEYTFVIPVPIADPTPPEALELLDLGF